MNQELNKGNANVVELRKTKIISRVKKFIRVALVIATLSTNTIPKPISAESSGPAQIGTANSLSELMKSPENMLNNKVAIFDFFDTVSGISTNEVFKGIDIDQTWKDMGLPGGLRNVDDFRYIIPKNKDQAKLLIATFFAMRYANHGKEVLRIVKNNSNIKSNITEFSITPAIEFDKIEYDEIGNPTITARLNIEKLSSMIASSSASIINLSLELGDMHIKYEFNTHGDYIYPELAKVNLGTVTIGEATTYTKATNGVSTIITKDEYDDILKKQSERKIKTYSPNDRSISYSDSFIGEQTEDNLRLLAELANRFPNKLFVVAGGNPDPVRLKRPDITNARKKLTEEKLWPSNLIIVGFEIQYKDSDGTHKFPAQLGVDYYIASDYLKSKGIGFYASYATPIVTAEIQRISGFFGNSQRLEQALQNLSKVANPEDGSDFQYRVIK